METGPILEAGVNPCFNSFYQTCRFEGIKRRERRARNATVWSGPLPLVVQVMPCLKRGRQLAAC
eukprot:6187394-Pleurochrysis_carterae.AAC.1